jgi:hypothetical protein
MVFVAKQHDLAPGRGMKKYYGMPRRNLRKNRPKKRGNSPKVHESDAVI